MFRGSESQSERFLEPGQCRTLESPLEAVYGPYSTPIINKREIIMNSDHKIIAQTMSDSSHIKNTTVREAQS